MVVVGDNILLFKYWTGALCKQIVGVWEFCVSEGFLVRGPNLLGFKLVYPPRMTVWVYWGQPHRQNDIA